MTERTTRILHIVGTLDPAAGGPTELIRMLLSSLPEGEVGEVVTLDDPQAAFLKNLPFIVHAMGPTRSTYGYTRRLRPWLRDNCERFDGVVLNGLWVYCGLATWLTLRGKKPYVVFSHGMLDPYFKRAFPKKHMKKWIYWVLAEYWILRGAYRVLFTTEAESRLAKQSFWLHRWHAEIISIGASRPPKNAGTLKEAFLEKYPEMRGRRSMLYLGRIHRKKGCDMLIRAFAKHAALDPELHLVMAGPDQQTWSGGLREMVAERGLSERVHWPGMLEGDVKWGSFFASEVFILPSHQENFGIAVAEALGCGLPVLLADKVNIAPEIALDGAGLMESDTQDGTDRLLQRWIEMGAEARAAMSVQALQTFDQRYDLKKNARAITHLFEESAKVATPV